MLRGSTAPNALDAQVVSILDDWVRRDAPRLDADNDGNFDDPGPAIMDTAWKPIVQTVMRPVFGNLLTDLDDVRNLGSFTGESYVDKDLRTLLRAKVRGKFHLRYCGHGNLKACRASLWTSFDTSVKDLAGRLGPDPTKWLIKAGRTTFTPGLIPNTMLSTNRPTFQQVLEFQR